MTKVARFTLAVAVGLWSGQALAENWVTVFDDEDSGIFAMVDKDSIHRGVDGLVYFIAEGGGKSDKAVNCRERVMYTLKLYAMDGINYPDWRNEGRPVVPGSVGEAMLDFACAAA